jgi:hypothetical protein
VKIDKKEVKRHALLIAVTTLPVAPTLTAPSTLTVAVAVDIIGES